MTDAYVPETFLGQILVDGQWLDYARGHEPQARAWQAEDPESRRVVDWIRKEQIQIPHTGSACADPRCCFN